MGDIFTITINLLLGTYLLPTFIEFVNVNINAYIIKIESCINFLYLPLTSLNF